MIKIKFVLFFLVIGIIQVSAQFNPDAAEKSLVKVMVTGGSKMGVCSGFMWKQQSWIVTSLHAMKPGGTIQVVYPGDNIREAKVLKVLETADLVLLETNIAAKPLTNEVKVLTSYHAGGVPFGETIYAIGYNGGSKGNQTQKLEKGHANPETLEFLVRPEDKSQLTSLGFPSMKLPIYFLNGSLLPGFSGSPVFNTKNDLIGIGDGGLERGLMNVSWCIPSSYLDQLDASTTSALPANIASASVLYSAEVSIDVASNQTADNFHEVQEQINKEYSSFSSGDFDFYQTKTRTWDQMKKTAVDPGNMESLVKDFAESKLNVDCNEMYFDIYEDINNGFVIAIPESAELHVLDKETNLFGVKLSDLDIKNDDANKYFELYYFTTGRDGDPATQLINFVKSGFTPENAEATIDPAYTKTYKINDEWTADYRFFNASAPLKDPDLGQVAAFYYICTIYNKESVFNSIAAAYIPINRKDLVDALEKGVDCIKDYDNNVTICDFFESFVKIIAAAHLTTISY